MLLEDVFTKKNFWQRTSGTERFFIEEISVDERIFYHQFPWKISGGAE